MRRCRFARFATPPSAPGSRPSSRPPPPARRRHGPRSGAAAHTLIAAPTGSGKTLAAFLAVIDELADEARRGRLDDTVRVVYVSPLKALSYDIERNLEAPLRGIAEWADRLGEPPVAIRAMGADRGHPARDAPGDDPPPPHILVTTPESLHILLTSESGRNALARTRTVIVDEIHAVAGNKRGAHLALTLERLEALWRGGIRGVVRRRRQRDGNGNHNRRSCPGRR